MNRYLKILFVVFLFADISFSFFQHLQVPLDGDMPGIIVPSQSYSAVLEDPFGVEVLVSDSVYPATNRFFAHWTMRSYFQVAPHIIQNFTDPINSIYVATALYKTLIQVFLLIILSMYVSGKTNLLHRDFLFSAILISPLFQTFGYHGIMGIIDQCVTYAHFYALAVGLILLFFLPFYLQLYGKTGNKLSLLSTFMLVIGSVVIAFNGPLNPGIVPIVAFFILYNYWKRNLSLFRDKPFISKSISALTAIPKSYSIILIFATVVCLYSYYIGRSNSESLWSTISLWERYAKLPAGFYYQMTSKIGPLLLLVMSIVNIIILKKMKADNSRLYQLLIWIGIFALIYTLLLPMGGYRDYRPNIIRRDTYLPVLLSLIFMYAITTLTVIKQLKHKKYFYYIPAALCWLIFINADIKIKRSNDCERYALTQLVESPNDVVALSNECTIIAWENYSDSTMSELRVELLKQWGVLKEDKQFYQKQE